MPDGDEGRGEIPAPPVHPWIVILDCPCGEEHIAPAGEGLEPISEWRYAC